jgi:Ca-activated chloride channel family protein
MSNQHQPLLKIVREAGAGFVASVGIGLITAFLLSLVVVLLPVTTGAAELGAQTPGTAGDAQGSAGSVRVQDVQSGSLLLSTGQAGLYRTAPVLETAVHMRVSGLVVRAKVVQRFRNPGNEWLEGVYVFPLPANAAVDHLRMRIGHRLIQGQIKERAEARRTYEQAKRSGKKASLLEQERPNMFTSSVANIGPGEEIAVEIEYQETLRYDHGNFRLRFPMVVAPRYIPGTPVQRNETISSYAGTGWAVDTDQVPDASRITPPVLHPSQGKINPVSLRIDLDAGFPLARLDSTYHRVHTTPRGEGKVTVTLAETDVPADRDFELVWAPDSGHVPSAALFTEPVDGEVYSLLMVLPPTAGVDRTRTLPREVIYVIDTSGSMGGASIRQARQALKLALDRLRPSDRFNVIQFNSVTTKLFQTARVADSINLGHAHRYVDSLRANGGTEMAAALMEALDGSQEAGRVRQVIFLTDGSVGNESGLFDLIKQRLGDSRLFTVGIGSAPNSHFMNKAAQYGRGTFTYIGDVREVQEKMSELFAKLESPVVTGLQVTWPAGQTIESWPRRLPDLYLGEPVVLTARLPRQEGVVAITGTRGSEQWRVKLPLAGGRIGAGIGALWARSKIAALMDSLHAGGDPQSVRTSVIDVALRHHLVSKYTSLVAVDVTPTRPDSAEVKKSLVPVNLPKGWVYKKVFGLPQTATPAELYMALGITLLLLAFGVRRQAKYAR